MPARIRHHIRSNVIGYLALFVALSGTAYATHPGGQNTISSPDIINGEVKNDDLGANAVGTNKINDRSVKNADLSTGAASSNTIADGGIRGVDVAADTLGGAHVDESSLETVPTADRAANADQLDGNDASQLGGIVTARVALPEIDTGLFEGRYAPITGITPVSGTTSPFDAVSMLSPPVPTTARDLTVRLTSAPGANNFRSAVVVLNDETWFRCTMVNAETTCEASGPVQVPANSQLALAFHASAEFGPPAPATDALVTWRWTAQ